VLLFSTAAWTGLGVIASCIWPYFSPRGFTDDYFGNISPLWFVPGGIISGFVIGFVLNRWMLVAYSSGPAKEVPVSWAARYGRHLWGLRGRLYIVVLFLLYIGCGQLRQLYYRSVIWGKVPGLSTSRSAHVRNWTIWAVVWHKAYKDPAGWDALINTLKNDPSHNVRCNAAIWLGEVDDPRAVDILIEMLRNNPVARERYCAAWGLGWSGDKRAVEPLIETLTKDKDPDTRRRAAQSLGRIGDPRAIEALENASKNDTDSRVRECAEDALREIREQEELKIRE